MPVLAKQQGKEMLDPRGDHPRLIDIKVRIVDSSNVESVAWVANGQGPVYGDPHLMIVKFKRGGKYGYIGVSRQRAVAAAYHPSTGKYIHDRIKPNFEVVKLA